MCVKCRLNVAVLSHSQMSDSSEFQIDGAMTLKARQAMSVLVCGTTIVGALDDRRDRAGTSVCNRLLKYSGVAVRCTLKLVSATNLSNIHTLSHCRKTSS